MPRWTESATIPRKLGILGKEADIVVWILVLRALIEQDERVSMIQQNRLIVTLVLPTTTAGIQNGAHDQRTMLGHVEYPL